MKEKYWFLTFPHAQSILSELYHSLRMGYLAIQNLGVVLIARRYFSSVPHRMQEAHIHKKETGASLLSQLDSVFKVFGRACRKLGVKEALLKGCVKTHMKVHGADVPQTQSYQVLVANFISMHLLFLT
jgi:hypothetical protein